MPPVEGTGTGTPPSDASEINERLNDMSYEEGAALSEQELDARLDEIVAGLSEEEREDILQDVAEEIRDDNNAYEERIRDLIRELRAAGRRGDEAREAQAAALEAELDTLLEAREEFTDRLTDTLRESMDDYEATHIDHTDGSNAVIEGDDLEHPVYEYEMGGRLSSDSPFGDGEYQMTDEEWLIENGYIDSDGERELRPGTEEYYTQEDIERALTERELARLNEQQRIEFNLDPDQTITAVSHDEATGVDVWLITDADGTTHEIIVRNANDVIYVINGGSTAAPEGSAETTEETSAEAAEEADAAEEASDDSESYFDGMVELVFVGIDNLTGAMEKILDDFEGTEDWPEDIQRRTYPRGSMNSFYDHNHGIRFDDSIPTYDFAGTDDIRGAVDRIEEFTGGLDSGHRDEYERAVERLFQAIEDDYTDAEIQELWQEMIAEGLPRDVIINLIVAFLRYGPDHFRRLFGGLSLPIIERALWNGSSGLNQHEKLAILILETQLGPGEYPVEEILAHGGGGDTLPTEGSWQDQEENLAALRILRTLPGADVAAINALIATEEALVVRTTEVASEGGQAIISQSDLDWVVNNSRRYADLFNQSYTYTRWDEWRNDAVDINAMQSNLIALFTELHEGDFSYREMADHILNFVRDRGENFACMVTYLLDEVFGILDDLMEASPGFAVGMWSVINNHGDDPIGVDSEHDVDFTDGSSWNAKDTLNMTGDT